MNTDLLKELGLTKAAAKIDKGLELKKKMAIAYENYRFVSPDVFERFQAQLKEKTYKKKGGEYGAGSFDTLKFIALSDYAEVPPPDCLLDLKKAKDMGCFDSFEIAKVETVEVRPDPIIFGLIKNCVDKFYITQWLDDVKIEDILKQHEG